MTWKKFDEQYEVSSEGHIRNSRTGRILREFQGKDGYLRTQFAGKSRTVHRVVANTYISPVEGKRFINHIDGNKTNNHVENLEWCTRGENMRHAYKLGLKSQIGIKNSRCKLSEDDVNYIRKNYVKGDEIFGARALAKRFGVAHQTISAVITGQNWK